MVYSPKKYRETEGVLVDGDMVMSSDNEILLKGSCKDYTNPISYDKSAAPSQEVSQRNFVKTDIRGFGTKVGTYSNYSTIIEAMRPLFKPGSAQDEELLLRKKLLREINGQEIDRIKGVDAKGPPKDEWLKFQRILQTDTDEEKNAKNYHNSLVLAKKPYFFRYLYSDLNVKYKRYEQKYNEACKCMFRVPLKKLLKKQNKNEDERVFVRRYYHYLPVLTTDCTMNILCREIESIDFDISYAKTNVSLLPHHDLSTYNIDEEILSKIRDIYRRFCNKKNVLLINQIFASVNPDEYKEVRFNAIDTAVDELREEYYALKLQPLDGLTYFYALSKSYSKFNWDVAWSILDEQILTCIEYHPALAPIECTDPGFGHEYLGRYYKLVEVEKEEDFSEEEIDIADDVMEGSV